MAAVLWLGATHADIDRQWPVAARMRIARQQKWAATGDAAQVDQTAHILALVLAALAITGLSCSPPHPIRRFFENGEKMDDQEIQEQLRRGLEEQERATRELARAIEEAACRDGGV